MTTDREAACWLMAALLIVVLTFGAAGCCPNHQTADRSDAAFAAGAPSTRWTLHDKADALPDLVAAAERAGTAERERAAALGFDEPWLGEPAAVVPLFTLEQATQLESVVAPHGGRLDPDAANSSNPTPARTRDADDESDNDAAAFGLEGPAGAGGALTDAATRGLRSAATMLDAAGPGQVALGLGGAAAFAFALQALAMVLALRTTAPAPTLTLGPTPTPFPRPPAGGAARPLPFPGVAAFGGASPARAA